MGPPLIFALKMFQAPALARTLPFWQEMEEFIATHAKSEKRHKEFGKDLLFAVCNCYGQISRSTSLLKLLENLLPFKISLDVKNSDGETPFGVCKRIGRWDVYEKLNLSQMGESLKG